jgi:indolepyruvate ferredoxin oxidoreductase
VFGYTGERAMERALIGEHRDGLERLLAMLTPANHAVLVEYAEVAQSIRGFGHVKQASVEAARKRWAELEAKARYLAQPMALAAE